MFAHAKEIYQAWPNRVWADLWHCRVEGAHRTYIMRGGTYALDPFQNDMALVLRAGAWLGAGLRSAFDTCTCTILSPAHLMGSRRTRPGQCKEG